MEGVKQMLEARREYLLQLKKEKENVLIDAPDGRLRIASWHEGKPQYYLRMNPRDFSGQYIRAADIHIAQNLAQKDYDKKVLTATDKELNAINKYFSTYPATNAESVYEKLNKERRKLVAPIVESDEKYIEKWEAVKYEGKAFDGDAPEFYTAKGERVRSKSEVIIADLLNRMAIPYRYEYPVFLKGAGTVYPDFTVLNVKLRKEIYLEHLGMMDDLPYVEKALLKISSYERNGIYPGERLILTYETRKNPLNQKEVAQKIMHYLQ